MTLLTIAGLIAAGLVIGILAPVRWRPWLLFGGSLLAVYVLQTPLTIRHLDFMLPTLTVILSSAVWYVTAQTRSRQDLLTLAVAAGLIVLLSLTRYLMRDLQITPSRPPSPDSVLLLLLFGGGLVLITYRISRRVILWGLLALLIVVLVVLKTPTLTEQTVIALRTRQGQSTDASLISGSLIAWLGISYITFRLIHVLREAQTGRLPDLSLREHLTYVLFFPSLVAGPIDRSERFDSDWQTLRTATSDTDRAARLLAGGERIVAGLFKKFVLSDSLALFALDAAGAEQAVSSGALWLMLYAYAFRLYWDFAGYTDIAIGIGMLCGIQLPENFRDPYRKRDIKLFWKSWHITLSDWVQHYVFSPLSRGLLRRRVNSTLAVFAGQMSTMLIIGLWHGVTWTFFAWGAWHGVGLFVHKVWSDRTRRWYLKLRKKPRYLRLWRAGATVINFHFVVLGWVWFALPDISLSTDVFLRLLGVNP